MRAYFDDQQITSSTSLINQWIEALSAQLENELGRYLQATSRTVYIDVPGNERVFYVMGYPITTITSITTDASRTFTGSALDSTSYDTTSLAYAQGRIELDAYPPKGNATIKVVYTGGLATTVDTLISSYPDIAAAVERQIYYWWGTRGFVGMAGRDGSEIGPGAQRLMQTLTWHQAHGDLLPEVWQIINKYRTFVPRW